MDIGDLIYENSVEACDKLLAMYNERGEIIKALKSELKQKEEKLSELTQGIPIEKAKETGNFYIIEITSGQITYAKGRYDKTKRVWVTSNELEWHEDLITRALPLHSQTQEGSNGCY